MTKEYFWHMTFEEFREYHFTCNPESHPAIVEDGWLHQVKMALECGNDVPEEVLTSHSEYRFVRNGDIWVIKSMEE